MRWAKHFYIAVLSSRLLYLQSYAATEALAEGIAIKLSRDRQGCHNVVNTRLVGGSGTRRCRSRIRLPGLAEGRGFCLTAALLPAAAAGGYDAASWSLVSDPEA